MKKKLRILPIILSIILTVIVFFALKSHNDRELRIEFEQKTKIMTRSLQYLLNTYLENLFAVENFYNASEKVNRSEFKQFVIPILERHKGIKALEWIPCVKNEERALFEDEARNDGYTDYYFTQKNDQGAMIIALKREKYFPVFYVEPFKNNENAFGYDLGSDPVRKKALDFSMQTGKPTATNKIKLVQDVQEGYGFLILIPVYKNPSKNDDNNSGSLKGFVSGVFSINDLINASLHDLYPDQIKYTICESDNTKNNDILYTHSPDKGKSIEIQDDIFWDSKISIVDKQWSIAYEPTSHFYKTHKRWDAWIISFLLGAFLFVLLRRSQEFEIENIKTKQARDELRTSETKVKRLLESAPDALLLVDVKGNILFANKEVETIFGYSPDELIGKWHDILVSESIRTIHTNHRNNYFKNPHTRPMGEGIELWGLKKDGQKFPIAIKLSPLKLEDQTQVICIVRDITKQKQSEDAIKQRANELNSLYEMGQGVSQFLSIDQVILSALKGIKDSIVPDTSDIFLRKGNELIPQSGHDKINGLINENQHFHKVGECLCGLAASTEKPLYSMDIRTDNRCTWTECKNAGVKSFASIPLKGKEGLIGVMGVGSLTTRDFGKQSDFLETLALQVGIALENALFYQKISTYADDLERQVDERTQEVQAALVKAESADHLKSAFLASMSHELRTPLNSIIGFTGILLQGIVGSLNEEQNKQLNMVKTSASHLLGLINDILDLSKIEAGEVKIQIEVIEYQKIVEKVIQTIQPLSDEKQLELSFELPDMPFQIKSDGQKVEQILINLINNAIKFTEKGSVKIRCTIDNDYLKTTIADTGIGLKKDELETVFGTFHQTDSGLARKYEGTGLGLSISKKLTGLLGGNIWAESDGKNKGCRFSFTLPIKEKGNI